MKLVTRAKWGGALCVGLLLALCSMSASADGTTAGTSVANKATVNYTVGTVAQAVIESSPTGNTTSGANNGTATAFVVDNLLVLTVTRKDTTIVSATPNSTTAATEFTVQNDGNAVQDAVLSGVIEPLATANPFTQTGSSNFAVTAVAVYADTNANDTYDSGTDLAVSSLASMAVGSGGKKDVFVVSTIPASASNAQFGVVGLLAKVGAAASGTAYSGDDSAATWDPTVVQNIFADGTPSATAATGDAIHDGAASDRDAYQIQSASLTITKTSAVITDPVYCTTPGDDTSCTLTGGQVPHALPGAVMRYTITIVSCDSTTCPGAQTATGISVNDDLSAQGSIVYLPGTITETVAGSAVTPCSDTADSDGCTFASNTVTVGNMTLAAGETAVVTFDVTIQ